MKKLITIAAVLALSTGTAFASGSSKKPTTPTQYQSQGQHQGQDQSQKAISNSDSYSDAYSDAYADAYAEATAKANANASNDNSGNTSVSVDGGTTTTTYHESRRPVNTAYAAPLVAGDDTCMGSTSAGGMGITFGFSFATTWKDGDCVVRKDARFLQNAQRQDIALSLMCSKPSVQAAVKRAGTDAEKRACGLDVPTATVIVPAKKEMYLGLGERG